MTGTPYFEFLILAVAGISVFSLLLTAGYVLLRQDKRAERVRSITMQPEEIGRLRQISAERAKQLRHKVQARVKIMRTILGQFRLQQAAASRELKLKLAAAGLRHPAAPITYVFSRLAMSVGAVLLVTVFTTLSERFESSVLMQVLLIGIAAAVGYVLPALAIRNAAGRRQQSMSDAFPDMLDTLLICVESGLSINAAFARVAEEMADTSPVLSAELALLSAEIAFLGDRRQAYTNFAERTGLTAARTLATSLNQADRYGTPVGTALQVLAQENREQRMAAAEKKAAALPAKLTVPMVVFFMPALFIVLLGPAMIGVMSM